VCGSGVAAWKQEHFDADLSKTRRGLCAAFDFALTGVSGASVRDDYVSKDVMN
jgi:hypothetical protein